MIDEGSTWIGSDTTQTYFLNIPNFGRTFDLSYYTDGTYDLFGNAYAQLQRSSNRSFPVDSDSKLIVSGDLLRTVMLLLSTLVGYCSE